MLESEFRFFWIGRLAFGRKKHVWFTPGPHASLHVRFYAEYSMTNNHEIYTPVLNILRSWPDSSCFIGKFEPYKSHSFEIWPCSALMGILLATNN